MVEEQYEFVEGCMHEIFSLTYNFCNRFFNESNSLGDIGIFSKPIYLLVGAGTSPQIWNQILRVLKKNLYSIFKCKENLCQYLCDFQGELPPEVATSLEEVISQTSLSQMTNILLRNQSLVGKIIHSHDRCDEIIDNICSDLQKIEESQSYNIGNKGISFRRKSLSSIVTALLLIFDSDFPVIFSTNWDTVIESTCEEIEKLSNSRNKKKFRKILCIEDWRDYLLDSGKFAFGIVKLNGCYTKRNVVLFAEYEELKGSLQREKLELLGLFEDLPEASFFVVGHSFNYDKGLIKILLDMDRLKFDIYWSATKGSDVEKIRENNFYLVMLSAGFAILSLAFNKWIAEKDELDLDGLRDKSETNPYHMILNAISKMIVEDFAVVDSMKKEARYLVSKLEKRISSLQEIEDSNSKGLLRACKNLRVSLKTFMKKCEILEKDLAYSREMGGWG